MTDDLVGRLRSYADTCTGLEPRRIIAEAADHIANAGKLVARIEALEGALDLALSYLIEDEPGDSRAVSDEFVAMAVILEGHDADGCLPIVKAAIAARAALAKDKSDG
jgi:hypothetical protein